MPAALSTRRLRTLGIDPHDHPQGRAHLSAASGLVCAHGRAYVIGDDEHHLAVFRDRDGPGALHRIVAGELPEPAPARKRLKPDFESLLWLPAQPRSGAEALVALGSGSRPNRQAGRLIPVRADGEPSPRVRGFDLAPLYGPLREALGEINIEGGFVIGDALWLLNRGVAGRSDSAAARYRLRDLRDLVDGRGEGARPSAIRRYRLGELDGVPLAFTDGAALPDGGWVYSAVAEDSANSFDDGPCRGSVVGAVDGYGELRWTRRLARRVKVEGIAVQVAGAATTVCMVTDADDPGQAAALLLARL